MSPAPSGSSRRLLIVAGEASGDLHGASLVRELREADPDLGVVGVGGDRMEREGVELIYHYRRLAVVGITEVLSHLGDVRRALSRLERSVAEREVDGVVLIDYPDFNLTLARRLRKSRPELPIVYYISPQVWAWRKGRVHTIAERVDRLLAILPFEPELYEPTGLRVDFVGHPLLDSMPEARSRDETAERHRIPADAEWIGLVPGSREAEVERLLPAMLGAAERLGEGRPDRVFLVAGASSVEAETYDRAIRQHVGSARVELVRDDTWELLRQARAAMVCSGTATLETALAGTPLVVVYRTSWLTYNLGKFLVRIPDIGLVNVVAGRRGVPELLQDDVTPDAIARELDPLLEDGPTRDDCLEFLEGVRARLGGPGASKRAARAVLETLSGGRRAGGDGGGHPR